MPITNSAQLQRASSEDFSIANANQTGIDTLTGSFTVEAWLKSDTDLKASGSNIFYVASRTNPLILRFIQNTTAGEALVQCFAQDGTNYLLNVSTTYVPTTTEWHHIAYTVNATNGDIKYYFDGVKREENLATGYRSYTANSDTLEIGANSGGSNWDGNICQVRIWSEERSATQIADNYNINFAANPRDRYAALEAEWKFDGNANDSTSNANNLTENGTISYETDIPTLTDEVVAGGAIKVPTLLTLGVG